jgi:predicted nucleic acid-binding protein
MAASWIVIDSGVFIATALPETLSEKAAKFLAQLNPQTSIAAPVLFQYEIVAALRKHVYRGTLMAADAQRSRDRLLSVPAVLMYDEGLVKRAYDLAEQLNRPTAYDAQYLALAERLRCEFWTADEKLFNAVQSALPWVQWLGQVSSNE